MSQALIDTPPSHDATDRLQLQPAACCICQANDGEPIAVGADFEYHTSDDTFLAMRCPNCKLVYLNPRPAPAELGRIYPATYHAFDFNPHEFGFVYRVRRRLEARRVLRYAQGLGPGARILDVGCGDGFHLGLLRDFGDRSWQLAGVEIEPRAAAVARAAGLTVHAAPIEELELPEASYDLVLLIMTVEHLADPALVLSEIARLLKPGGKVVIVTDDAGSPSFWCFAGRHWGGYHFPRHWYLFDQTNLARLARQVGLDPEWVGSLMSPVNWTYSIHNLLVDLHAPRWLVNRFTLKSPVALAAFTLLDQLLHLCGKGSLICATLRRPVEEQHA